MLAASSRSKNTTASTAIAPPLVAPKDSTSTPAFQVTSAGLAFIRQDMRLGMREHRAPGRADVSKRERVRRRAGRHQEHRGVAFEDLADPTLDRAGHVVIAIAHGEAIVAGGEGLQDFRGDAGGV